MGLNKNRDTVWEPCSRCERKFNQLEDIIREFAADFTRYKNLVAKKMAAYELEIVRLDGSLNVTTRDGCDKERIRLLRADDIRTG
jgi:hypothetical protein